MKALTFTNRKMWPMQKFLRTDKRTDGQTDRPKTICPDLSMQGHKKNFPSNFRSQILSSKASDLNMIKNTQYIDESSDNYGNRLVRVMLQKKRCQAGYHLSNT